MRVSPGGYSTVASQTVVNSGSQEFKSVQVRPTPWYIDPDGRPDPGRHPSLSASLAEISMDGPREAYEPLAEGTAVSSGLFPGGEDRIWFRVNLSEYPELPGSSLVQYVTYTAECAPAQ